MLISNGRLYLDKVKAHDEPFFIDAATRSRGVHYPWVSPPNTVQAFEMYLEQTYQNNFEGLLVKRIADDALVGVFNLSNIIRGCFQSTFLGYYVFEGFQNKGSMTQALQMVIDYAFFHLDLHRIEANIQPNNHSSIKLVKKCGFVEEGLAKNYLKINGRWQDHLHFGLTLEQAQYHWIELAHQKTKPWLADFQFSPKSLGAFLQDKKNCFNEPIKSVKLLGQGWDNDVLCVNKYWIFRCPRRKVAASLIPREDKALIFLKGKLPIAIPEISYQYLGPAEFPYPFHGYAKLPGQPIYHVNLTDEQQRCALQDFARFLKALHSISLSELIDAEIEPQVFNRLQVERIAGQIQSRLTQENMTHFISGSLKTTVLTICKQAQSLYLNPDAKCLVHGDLYSKHLLFHQGELSGIIDWGDVGLNHPVIDLAAVYSIFPAETHSLFYAIYGELDNTITTYAKFLAIHSLLACMDYGLENDEKDLFDESFRMLKQLR
jgi:ribosomal-protein-alanine N-acetyltransferase